MNYRDLQNISNLSQEILIEGAKKEHNVLNRWPYTSPYLQESTELDEASVTDDRVRRNQKAFGSNYTPPRDWDQSANRGKGAVLNTKQKEKQRRKGLAKGAMGEAVDLYDIILSHLLDEGYAETQEQAEVIMVNMSEGWRESIVEEVFNEGYKRLPRIKMAKQMLRKASSAFKGAHKTGIEGDSPETTGGQIAVQKGMKKMKQAYKMHDVATGHSAERSKSKEKENKSPIKKSGSTITIGLRKGGSSSDGRTITIGGKGENSQSKRKSNGYMDSIVRGLKDGINDALP